MRDFFIQTFTALAILVVGAINLVLIWAFHRQWWRYRGVRRAVMFFPSIGVAVAVLWGVQHALGFTFGERLFAFLAALCFLLSVAVMLSLPISGLALTLERFVRWITSRIRRNGARQGDDTRRAETGTPVNDPTLFPAPVSYPAAASDPVPETSTRQTSLGIDERDRLISSPVSTRSAQPVAPRDEQIDASRRSFVTLAAAAVPAVATGSGLYGLTSSQSPVVLPNIPMIFDNLPPELEGLRIMQITDLHLGYYITLDTLAEMLLTAAPHRPDLVLITGDVSDDLSVLPEALRMIDALKPRFGTFASLGNHEYYRGIEEVRRIYDRSPIPLLVEEGVAIPVRGVELFIGGGDDPARKDEAEMNKEAFFKQTVEHTFRESSERAFRLLMSHRPEGFDPAAELGIPMTIAGHTHAGGQLGWRGRGLFEAWFGMGKYLWGHYEKNDGRSRLYTSAGCGHWFPFRLGVPREVPVYVLRRTPDADRFA